MKVRITDINDNPPSFKESSYTFSVQEDKLFGYTVGTMSADDPDSGLLPIALFVFFLLYNTFICSFHERKYIVNRNEQDFSDFSAVLWNYPNGVNQRLPQMLPY